MLALKRLSEKHMLIKLAAQTNKRTQILIQTGRGKRQGGTNNDMCSASASGNTVLINLHYISDMRRHTMLEIDLVMPYAQMSYMYVCVCMYVYTCNIQYRR